MNEYKQNEDSVSDATDVNTSIVRAKDRENLDELVEGLSTEYDNIVHLSAQVQEDTFFHQLIYSEVI